MPTMIMETSPKFITCPDCGERYDNARKRRLIDTCGHPRCYSCLFVDNACPLCEKLPKPRPKSTLGIRTYENTDKLQSNLKSSSDDSYMGSHPNLSELHKSRSATLPPAFRQDSYFRSLYRYQPHGSSENLSTRSTSPTPRPRSMPPTYHESLENLHEQFWKSVQLAERKWSPAKPRKNMSKENEDGNSSTAQSTTEIVECPAPDVVRLPVPTILRPHAHYYHKHHEDGHKANRTQGEVETRPRSLSDIHQSHSLRRIVNDNIEGAAGSWGTSRPLSWSPIQSPAADGSQFGCRSTSSLSDRSRDSRNSSCSSPPRSWSPTPRQSSSISMSSDKTSDASSIHSSDTCSESSGDSDSIYSGIQSPTYSRNDRSFNIPRAGSDAFPSNPSPTHSSRTSSSPSPSSRRFPVNPLANVTYWVVDSGKSALEVNKSYKETNLDEVVSHRPLPTHAQNWNGQTNRAPTISVVSVQTEVGTL